VAFVRGTKQRLAGTGPHSYSGTALRFALNGTAAYMGSDRRQGLLPSVRTEAGKLIWSKVDGWGGCMCILARPAVLEQHGYSPAPYRRDFFAFYAANRQRTCGWRTYDAHGRSSG